MVCRFRVCGLEFSVNVLGFRDYRLEFRNNKNSVVQVMASYSPYESHVIKYILTKMWT